MVLRRHSPLRSIWRAFVYTVALAFSLSHVVVLMWLGSPDPGLIASTRISALDSFGTSGWGADGLTTNTPQASRAPHLMLRSQSAEALNCTTWTGKFRSLPT